MANRDNRGDFDGVRITAHPRRARLVHWLLLAAVMVAVGAGWWVSARRAGHAGAEPRHARTDAAASDGGGVSAAVQPHGVPGPGVPTAGGRIAGPEPAPGARASATRSADGVDPTPDLSDYVLPGEAPTMKQVIEALHARGIRTGLGAFEPPGTSPPLKGLVVPEEFPLPEGYVRHHQATDDGRRIAPILMFAPDLDWIVVRGERVRIPQNRVVPPELAPPGLPLRWAVIPPPQDAGGRR